MVRVMRSCNTHQDGEVGRANGRVWQDWKLEGATNPAMLLDSQRSEDCF